MTRKALVTGGAGFIGSTLVDLLVDRDWEVLVVDDLRTGSMDNLGAARRRGKVSIHVMDIRAEELPEAAGRFGPEVVFHLAAQTKVPYSVEDPPRERGEPTPRATRVPGETGTRIGRARWMGPAIRRRLHEARQLGQSPFRLSAPLGRDAAHEREDHAV